MSWILAPFHFILRMLQTLATLVFFAILLVIAPFLAYFTMPGYQHDANKAVTSDPSREFLLIDFASNVSLAIPADAEFPAHLEPMPKGYDYQSLAAHEFGRVPPDWGIYNLIGFYGDTDTWTRGKEAPMYAAYAEAATSSDALRQALKVTNPDARLHFAPKIGMAWTTGLPMPVLYGVCPFEKCNAKVNFRFNEARELFTPSLSAGQAEAVAKMQYMMSDEYWVREAHANGIKDADDWFRQMAAQNRRDLLIQYTSTTRTAQVLVGMEVGYLILVVFVMVLLVFKIGRVLVGHGGHQEERQFEV